VLLDVRNLSGVADFFVICSSNSAIGVKTIAEEIVLNLKKEKMRAHHVEGMNEGTWVLVDYGDVIVHVFLEHIRRYFDIESFWGDAPRKSFRPKAAASAPRRASKPKKK
jgi:ribosome-associated protein